MNNQNNQKKLNTLKKLKLLFYIPLYMLAIWLLGFAFYIIRIPEEKTLDSLPKAEAIVVLTGDSQRIEKGIALLKAGKAPKLFVSGVNQTVQVSDLMALTGESRDLFDCCVTLGRSAANTVGNAFEVQQWRFAENIKGLILVTSDYHMPRAMLVFSTLDPEAVYYSVATDSSASLGFFIREYNKYIITLLRNIRGKDLKPAGQHQSTTPKTTQE